MCSGASPTADASWQVTQGRNGSNTSSADFYIVNTSDAYEDCGFQGSNQTAPSGASMTGFMKCEHNIANLTAFLSIYVMTDT